MSKAFIGFYDTLLCISSLRFALIMNLFLPILLLNPPLQKMVDLWTENRRFFKGAFYFRLLIEKTVHKVLFLFAEI